MASTRVALPVYVWKMPIPINNKLDRAARALSVLYGDCYMRQYGQRMVFYTDGEICNCHRCADYLEVLARSLDALANEEHDWAEFNGGMIVCPDCGNKRCPHASDHRLECTRSNEPGQLGSVYQ